MVLLDKEQIKQIIPHRDPFLLIDEVEEMELGKRVVAKKYIAPDSYWFQGHFPGHPVTPGVLTIEMLAQAGAVAILSLEENQGKTAYFGGIKNCRFRGKVVPGDKLRLETKIIKQKGPLGIGEAIASVDGKVVVSAELSFMIG